MSQSLLLATPVLCKGFTSGVAMVERGVYMDSPPWVLSLTKVNNLLLLLDVQLMSHKD